MEEILVTVRERPFSPEDRKYQLPADLGQLHLYLIFGALSLFHSLAHSCFSFFNISDLLFPFKIEDLELSFFLFLFRAKKSSPLFNGTFTSFFSLILFQWRESV
uniref:Centromere-associated protein E n=1 Tax=Rhizophora mucronata TaxID=61149 RepID=A0A2P2ILT9_RHIMU